MGKIKISSSEIELVASIEEVMHSQVVLDGKDTGHLLIDLIAGGMEQKVLKAGKKIPENKRYILSTDKDNFILKIVDGSQFP